MLWRDGFKESWTKLFFIFLPNFCHSWWFFKVICTEGAKKHWKIINNAKNLAKKLKLKTLFNLPHTHISADSRYPNIWFRLSDMSITTTYYLWHQAQVFDVKQISLMIHPPLLARFLREKKWSTNSTFGKCFGMFLWLKITQNEIL